ncbi:hypothetical protein KKH39_00180 [Patescibacteria group bacterium]|nr:hypothetical protein [Patescibacteria group bacterium]
MGNFNRDRGGRSGDRRDRGGFDRRGSGGGFNRGGGGFDRPSMHKAICDACHKECEVPFKPRGDKPIYCSDCFSKQGGGDRGARDRRPSFEDRGAKVAQDSKEKEILKAIKTLNYKVDQLMKVLVPDAPTTEVEADETPVVVEVKATSKKKVVAKKAPAKKKAAPKKKAVAKKK